MHLSIVPNAYMQSSNKFRSYLLNWLLLIMQLFLNSKVSSSGRPSLIFISKVMPILTHVADHPLSYHFVLLLSWHFSSLK